MPCQEFVEAGPSDHALTITPRQPLAPNSHYLIGEPAQASTVTADAVVGEVAPHHRGQMAMLVAEGPVAVFRHQPLTAATARANRLLAVTCRTMSLPFRDRPQTWVRPRKSKVVPSVSGWCAPCDLFGRKSTRRVLSGWRVSPYRARRLPRTDSTRLASTMLSNAISASSANRTRVHSPLRRGFTTVSNHSSSTWCRKTFERQGEITPPCGEPSVVRRRKPSSTAPAFSHLSIILRMTPSVTRWSRNARRWECEIESKYLRMSISSTQ